MRTIAQRLPRRQVTAAVAVLALLVAGSGMTFFAAQAALPGDVFYPIKTTLEQARLTLAADGATEAQLHLEFAQRRLDELAALIEAGRFESVNEAAGALEFHVGKAIEAFQLAAAGDPARVQELALQIAAALSRYARTLGALLASVPDSARPALTQAILATGERFTKGSARDGEIEFTGAVEAIGAGSWTVGGRAVALTSQTQIKGPIQLGDIVKVHARQAGDGSLVAREIEVAGADVPLAEVKLVGVVESMSATSWRISGRTFILVPQTEIRDFIRVGNLVEVRALTDADGSLTAIRIELEEDEQGTEVRFTGIVQAIEAEIWTIGGRTVRVVSSLTEIKDFILVGDLVEVRAHLDGNGALAAFRIELED